MTIAPVSGQLNTGNNGAGSTSVTVTIPSGITQGNLVVVHLGWNATITSPAGPSGWSSTTGPIASAGGSFEAQQWYLLVDAGHAGQTSFNFTWTNNAVCVWTIREWNSTTGWQASPLDKTASGNTSGTTVDTGTTATTTTAVELWDALLGWGDTGQTESGLTAGFTSGQLSALSFASVREAYQAVAATGTAHCAETISAFEQTAAIISTFAAAAAATVPGTVQPRATVPVPRRKLVRAVWARITGQAYVAVPAPRQEYQLLPRRKPARAVWRAGAGQAYVFVPAPVQQFRTAPRRKLARAYVQFTPVTTTNAAGGAGVAGTVPALMVNQTRVAVRRDGRVVRQ